VEITKKSNFFTWTINALLFLEQIDFLYKLVWYVIAILTDYRSLTAISGIPYTKTNFKGNPPTK